MLVVTSLSYSAAPLLSQDWFRVSPVKNTNVFILLSNLVQCLGDTHTFSLILGIVALLILIALKKYKRTAKVPGALVVVILSIAVMGFIYLGTGKAGKLIPNFTAFTAKFTDIWFTGMGWWYSVEFS